MSRGRRLRTHLLAVCGFSLLVSCASTPPGWLQRTVFAPELGVDIAALERLPSGVYVRDLRIGGGPAARRGSRVEVHYVGWLPDGTMMDHRVPPEEPFRFRLGAGEVIQGWEEGILGMRVGGQRRLVVPAALAYGARGGPGIPPDTPLVFIVDLLGVR